MRHHHRLQIGDTLENKYQILALLGEGGMGVVYQCLHVDLNKVVAVKVLLPFDPGDTTILDRFKTEARSSASIKHANVVDVFDYGITPDGRPFFVMEYLEGESLAAVLDREGRMRERDIVDIIDQVLTGLSAAHKRNIIHRDLKPENVFLTRNDDGQREVKILDFGIAKISGVVGASRMVSAANRPNHREAPPRRLQTEEGVVMGTPGYMAPETLDGRGKIDTRADLYAVGVILYEMLTGRFPFSGQDPIQIMRETAHRPVPMLRAINPKISEPMEQLCLIALAKDPLDRFQNTQEFIAYLSAAAVGRFPRNARECRTEVGMPSVIPLSPVAKKKYKKAPKKRDEFELDFGETPPHRRGTLLRDRHALDVSDTDYVIGPEGQRARRKAQAVKPYIGRARTRFPLLVVPWGKVLFILALGGACYYYFVYQSPFRDTHSVTGRNIPGALRTTATLHNTANAQGDAEDERFSIWLKLSPSDATVLVDGDIHTSRPLRLSKSNRPVRIEIVRAGYSRHVTTVIPIREQTLTVQLQRTTAPNLHENP